MTEDADVRAWLRLLDAPEIGRATARRLLAAFGSPGAVLAADTAARRAVVGPAAAAALDVADPAAEARIDAALAWLHAEAPERRTIVALGDLLYPPMLLQAGDPPLLLYVVGDPALLQAPAVAIVGSRNPTAQGSENARAFARQLSDAGLAVVSGLALGIDTAAHEGALAGSTPTIAVVGTGLDRVYPKRNLALARRIAATGGALVSEFPLGTLPLPEHFPMRNRIIAGLGEGTLVVEAALRSGSLLTARLSVDANREVFAIPGSIHSPLSRGCHALIRQGAKLVESAADILEELRPGGASRSATVDDAPTADDDDPVLAVLGFDPATLDALAGRSGLSAAELSVRLLELELAGRVARLPGQLFQRIGAP